MTEVIVLYRYSKNFSNSSPFEETANANDVFHCLSDLQQQFVRRYTWRTELNWQTGEIELSIRKSQFSTEEWTRILFLFPLARLRQGPVK